MLSCSEMSESIINHLTVSFIRELTGDNLPAAHSSFHKRQFHLPRTIHYTEVEWIYSGSMPWNRGWCSPVSETTPTKRRIRRKAATTERNPANGEKIFIGSSALPLYDTEPSVPTRHAATVNCTQHRTRRPWYVYSRRQSGGKKYASEITTITFIVQRGKCQHNTR